MQLFPLAMLPDTIAVDGARSGRQRARGFTGGWTAGAAAGCARRPGVVGLVLAATGFVSSAGGDVAQPASARAGVVTVFALVPAVLVAASLPLIRRYRLPDDAPDDRPVDG